VSGWGTQVVDSRFHRQSFVRVAAGDAHTLALRPDGTIAAFGDNGDRECDVPPLPAGVTYVDFAAGGSVHWNSGFTVALRSDGTVVAWGENVVGQCNVPPLLPGTS
jgi:alpha-tubulin suppressor-like RCC1 family protein